LLLGLLHGVYVGLKNRKDNETRFRSTEAQQNFWRIPRVTLQWRVLLVRGLRTLTWNGADATS